MRDPAQVEVVEDQLARPLDQPGVRVVRRVERLVRTAEADQVRHHAPDPATSEHVDHVPVEERPGGFAVQQQGCRPVRRSRIDVRHAQGATVRVGDLGVPRLPGEVRAVVERVVRGSVDLHGDQSRATLGGSSGRSRVEGVEHVVQVLPQVLRVVCGHPLQSSDLGLLPHAPPRHLDADALGSRLRLVDRPLGLEPGGLDESFRLSLRRTHQCLRLLPGCGDDLRCLGPGLRAPLAVSRAVISNSRTAEGDRGPGTATCPTGPSSCRLPAALRTSSS